MINAKKQVVNSVLAFLLSFLASSHHWLHMGILLLLGGSTDMMTTMTAMVWVKRVMIIGTIIMVLYSVYRLYKHRCKDKKMISITALSVILSLYFIISTIIKVGW